MSDGIRRDVLCGRMAQRGFNKSTLARSIHVSRTTLGAFFGGAAPSFGLICKLKKELGLTPEEVGMIFFGDEANSAAQ